MKPRDDAGTIFVLAPTRRRAREGALRVVELSPGRTVLALSWDRFASAGTAVERVVLCPTGVSVSADVRFLARVARRALWPAPPRPLHDAIAGLLPDLPPGDAGSAAIHDARPALLLEGRVTPARIRAAVASDTRHWIVEHAALPTVSARTLTSLERRGVRWSALRPIRPLAVLASPALARARERWRSLLPSETAVWVFERT